MVKKLAYVLLPINVLIDTLLLFSEQLSWLPLVRAGLLLALVIYVFSHFGGHMKYYSAIVVFLLFCLMQLFFVSDFQKSLVMTLKIGLPIASFAIGFHLFNTFQELRKLSISVIWVYLILGGNFLLSQLFQLGQSVYSDESNFRVGNLDDSWNVFTYAVLLAPLVIHFVGKSKYLRLTAYLGAIGNAMLVVISIKRIAILGLVSGNLIRMYFVPKNLKWIRSALFATGAMLVAFLFIQDIVLERIELRSNRFESGSIEREGRYLETSYVWDEVITFRNPVKSLLGLEGFNSVSNYADGRFGDRQLHVDYNLIVNTIGLVGLILYFLLFLQIFKNMLRFRHCMISHPRSRVILLSVFWMLFINQFITSTAGQMYHVSYRLIVFVFLGSILGNFVRVAQVESASRNVNYLISE
jgi:hypothetical protein